MFLIISLQASNSARSKKKEEGPQTEEGIDFLLRQVVHFCTAPDSLTFTGFLTHKAIRVCKHLLITHSELTHMKMTVKQEKYQENFISSEKREEY